MSLLTKLQSDYPRVLATIAGIIVLYIFFTWGISTNPPGFYVDESCIAYNGYLIATTGTAENGTRFPLFVQCYTERYSQYLSAGQPYAIALLYLFWPPSTLSARMFAATTVFLAILLLGLLAARISGRREIGYVIAISGMVNPWLFETSRLVLETFFLIFCVVFFLFSLYNAFKREKWTLTDNFLIAVSLIFLTYSYSAGRMIAPLLAIGLLIFAVNKRGIWDVFKTWAIYAMGMIPIIVVYFTNTTVLTGRFLRATSLSGEKSIIENIRTVAEALWQDISLKFYIFDGDALIRHHIPGIGEFLVGTFALGVLGLVLILLRQLSSPWWRYVLYGAFVSMLPGSITYERYHSLRNLAFPIFFFLMMVPALSWLFGTSTDGDRERRPSERIQQQHSFTRLFGIKVPDRYLRLGLLSALLLLTAVQAIQFQILYREIGTNEERQNAFHEAYPRIFNKALAEGSRPIYLKDTGEPDYTHALWNAAVQGVDRSNFVHLLDRQAPPMGALVLSDGSKCDHCDVIANDGTFILYRNTRSDTEISIFEAGPGDEPGQFLLDPRGIASDGAGYIYIADTGNARIQKFSPDGKFVAAIGERGSGRGQLEAPNGVAIDSTGNVFVTDTVNQKLVEYRSNGSLVNEWTNVDSPFYGPRDIAFGPNKVLYIVDQGRTRIVMFDTSTESFRAWGGGGSGEGQFNEATGISVGANMVFVTDRGNNRVQVFDLDGKFIRQWKIPEWGESTDQFPDLAYDDGSKQLYITSGKTNQLLSFDTNGKPLDGKLKPIGDASLKNPSSVIISTVGTSKRLYVLNTSSANVAAFDLPK